jgi:hypothetical protein
MLRLVRYWKGTLVISFTLAAGLAVIGKIFGGHSAATAVTHPVTQTKVAAHTAVAVHGHATASHALAAKVGVGMVITGTTLEATTAGGILFVAVLNELVKDARKRTQAQERMGPSAAELKKCIDMALWQARQAMSTSGSYGSEDQAETQTLAARAQLVLTV